MTDFPATKSVLAAYRSTEAHITQEQITAAWSEYEALRDLYATLRRLPIQQHNRTAGEQQAVEAFTSAMVLCMDLFGVPGDGR